MRTEKELWDVVLSRPDLFKSGLCTWLYSIWRNELISYEEYITIIRRVKRSGLGYFIGPMGQIQPRIDWINERIKQLES